MDKLNRLRGRVAIAAGALLCGAALVAGAQSGSAPAAVPAELTREQAKKLVNPVSYVKASVGRGRSLYLSHCAECHDEDGKALAAIIADATDLTDPKSWLHGASDGEIFKSIRDGAGDEMPPFKHLIRKEQDVWHVVNFVHGLRSDSRPFADEAAKISEPAGSAKGELEGDPKTWRNPVAYTKASIARGRSVYLHSCAECHDEDGKALANIISDAADLTAPATWLYGKTDGELFKNIRDGSGDEMPPFKKVIKDDEQIWRMVNFIRSIGPKKFRPELVKKESNQTKP